ncbi:DNA-binding transcriptional regulator GbsR, MarR family [Microbacterium azadirachtae]|uniref:DNA-binding transcriptional regulator GbsR, MarR family n=1 Tax=Microbacterium azadirachtae TaxID=582680 RepID=A0A1I6I7M8_9MICO|nr:helix-turn-helix domain-containing protein [Microbacterium azadirachtae]SFR62380.1 DNA-binding transcriptional regulator GbsR, MarR family [Microbacterium azadirachtae]
MNAQAPEPPVHHGVDAAEEAAAMITAVGFPRMPGRVMMALIAAPAEGYSAADLADRLGISAAAVSGAVRYLQTIQVIRRVSRPDRRRDHYVIIPDTWYGLMTNNGPIYERLATHIEAIGAEHDDDHAARRRAAEMAEFFRFMARRMPELVDEWEAFRAEHHPPA